MKTSKKETESNVKLPVIKCFCGAKILLIPDVKLMSEAIEAHIGKSHKSKTKNPEENEAEAEKVRDYLIAQVFDKTSRTENI